LKFPHLLAGHADAIAFGRIFISNPDLPRRLRHGFPLTPYNRATFYGGEEAGYTDYPVYDEMAPASKSRAKHGESSGSRGTGEGPMPLRQGRL
jgi:hypothetical protein